MADVKQRAGRYLILQKILTTVRAIDESTVTPHEIKAHLESANQTWDKLEKSHELIINTTADDAALVLQMDTYEPMQICHSKNKTELYRLQYEDWPTFQDLFTASIHNNKLLSGSQKLTYLKNSLKGEAASLIKSFTVTDANYREAWMLLEEQYENKREIVHSHVKRLLFQPQLKSESAAALQELLTTTMECLRSLKVMGRPTDTWDDLTSVLLIEKFDWDTKGEWARSYKKKDPPTFKDVQDFIQQHIRTLHAKGPSRQPTTKVNSNSVPARRMNTHHSTFQQCAYCKAGHLIFQCPKLKDLSPEKRFSAVKTLNLCLNCLRQGHSYKTCTSSHKCKKCDKPHNTFLHFDPVKHKSSYPQVEEACSSPSGSSLALGIHTASVCHDSPRLLKTALVDVMDSNNVRRQVRVFIDEGGEGSLIREATMNSLGLKKQRSDVIISGVCGTTASKSRWMTHVRLYSRTSNSSIDVQLHAVHKVTNTINRLHHSSNINWHHIDGLQLADPQFYQGGEIDILIGADTAPYVIKAGLKKSDRSAPVAQDTIFGWVLTGNVMGSQLSTFAINNFKCEISSTLRKFWEVEEIPNEQINTREEEMCEQHFMSTHQRQPDGRYAVRLPFNEKKELLGDSRDQAYRRLQSLERRFKREPQYKQAYIDFIREYELLGHMEKVKVTQQPVKAFYLPHHFVLKEDSTTTKQRTVFDGSAKTTSGISLNDALLVGPTVQPDLFTLLLGFRYHKVALEADIAKMYRQFTVHEDDRDFQRILFREDPWLQVQEYRLTTVTYGTASAPFAATRCLVQLANDEKKKYPAASQALLNQMYVDDYLGSVPSQEEAINLVKELINITAAAGMEIRKWCSSDKDVLDSIPDNLREQCTAYEFDDNSSATSVKALGIKWQPTTDQFSFSVKINTSENPTKRFLLSEISKTFDPLGWLAPVTINAKLLLQKVWLGGHDWDDVVAEQLQQEWMEYQHNLQQVEDIHIPRCIVEGNPVKIEIHGFSDSSELAFCAAIYVKWYYKSGQISIYLLTARTKVAPLKFMSLPKLELCGAGLLAELVTVVKKSSDWSNTTIFCWTDSTIVLRWISSHSRKWKTFVANRVSSIQSQVPPECWHHVRSADNPADLPTRGLSTAQLIASDLWWHGPQFLHAETYSITPFTCNEEEVEKEAKHKQLTFLHLAQSSTHSSLFNQFSSLKKLVRSGAYLIRFIQYLQCKRKNINKAALSVEELHTSKIKLIKWAQSVSFVQEISQLKSEKTISSSSKLVQLTPFLDGENVLRVGGRIQRATLPFASRHPSILPHDHPLTELLIEDAHHTTLHGGFTLTHSTLRQQYWILRSRDSIRHFIRKCITCRKVRATTATQLMGSLPSGRVTASRAFLHCGVDFAGPFSVKMKKGRHIPIDKAYMAIFVCFATKAVHLEAVTSLSSEAFIACFERFISRRGTSSHLYSDCGTNFVGADKILNQFLQQEKENLQQQFTVKGTRWHFNPPSAPHQGGLWEAGVKSVKFHFRRVVGTAILNFEQFQTLLCKIEACLNSRPLCALSSDPADMDALTPGHFIIGGPLTNIPEPNVTHVKQNRLSYWETVRQMTQHFWNRWSTEYLSSLQQRFKWTQKRENLKVGDLVIIADDQMPVTRWKMGRVSETKSGDDGLVRSATVKTSFGELNRPVTKLSPLITSDDD